MIDKRKPFKTCPACNKRKAAYKFGTRTRIANGMETIYNTSRCKDCQNKETKRRYIRKTPDRKKVTRRCHSCYKHKRLKDFARTKRHGVLTYHGNCKHCEETRDLDLTRYHEGSRREHDTINNRHYIAFIGKASFKEVCKVFKIRYEK